MEPFALNAKSYAIKTIGQIGESFMAGMATRFQAQAQASNAAMQGSSTQFAHEMNINQLRRDQNTTQELYQQELDNLNQNMKVHIDELRYQYAAAGQPVVSGTSASANINSNMSQAEIQKSLLASAATEQLLNLQLAVIQSEYGAAVSKISTDLQVKNAQRQAKMGTANAVFGAAQALVTGTGLSLQAAGGEGTWGDLWKAWFGSKPKLPTGVDASAAGVRNA